MFPFPLFLAVRYLKPRRSILSVVTAMSIIGVLLGVAILIIVLSVMTGFGNMWKQKILSFKPHILIAATRGVVEREDALCQRLERMPGIVGAAPVIITRALMRHGDRVATPVVIGVDPERARAISRVPANTLPAFEIEGEGIVLGCDLAERLAVSAGSRVLIYSPRNVVASDEMYLPLEAVVRGVFDMGMRDYDAEFAFASLDFARRLMGWNRGAHALYLMTANPMTVETQAAAVRSALGPEYWVRTWKEEDRVLFEALTTEKTMMFILLVFITVVAIFCVTNTLIVVTVQKTDEMGLLKALGFSPGVLRASFVLHGWMQCATGIILGLAVAFLVLANLTQLVRFLAQFGLRVFPKAIYGLSEIPWDISWSEVVIVVAVVMVFCTLAALLPAGRAARLDPVAALRRE